METPGINAKVEEFLRALSRGTQVWLMYGESHRLSAEAADRVYSLISELLEEEEEITVGVIGDELAFRKEPFMEASKMLKGFIEHLLEIGLRKISFARGIGRNEIVDLIRLLTMRTESLKAMGGLEEMMSHMRMPHVAVGEIGYAKDRQQGGGEEGIPAPMQGRFEEGVEFLSERMKGIKGNQPLNAESARQIVDGLIGDVIEHKNLLMMLTSIKGHDENMFEHGVNVAIFTLMQAQVLGISDEHLGDIGMAALLHDTGELSETGDEEKGRGDEKYPGEKNVLGAKILLDTPGISKLAAITAFEHDMNFDMSGEPRKLYGKDELNLVSMIIAIADHYDKLRRRPEFLEEGGPEKAYREMVDLAGKKFHPDLLKNFFSLMGVYPPGTLVELDSGEVGLVIQSSMLDIERPQIVGSSRVDLQACKLEYSIVSPK